MWRIPVFLGGLCLVSTRLAAQNQAMSVEDSIAAAVAAIDTVLPKIPTPVHLSVRSEPNELPTPMGAFKSAAIVLGVAKLARLDTMGVAATGETCESTPPEQLRAPRKCRYAKTTSMLAFEFLPCEPGVLEVHVMAASNAQNPDEGLLRQNWDVTLVRAASGWRIVEVRLLTALHGTLAGPRPPCAQSGGHQRSFRR
jgi:hypothetical protein